MFDYGAAFSPQHAADAATPPLMPLPPRYAC